MISFDTKSIAALRARDQMRDRHQEHRDAPRLRREVGDHESIAALEVRATCMMSSESIAALRVRDHCTFVGEIKSITALRVRDRIVALTLRGAS